MSEHTAGPYKVGSNTWDDTKYWTIEDSSGEIVCMEPVEFYAYPEGPFIEPSGKHAANAEFIVRACNAHDDLLAVCESALAKAESDLSGEMRLNESHLYDMRAAITKAKPPR